MKNIKFFEDFNSEVPAQEIHEGHDEMQNYMFFQNLHTLKNAIDELIELDPVKVDAILADGHGWALDHVATSVDDVEEVYHFLSNSIEMGHEGEEHHGEDEEETEMEDDELTFEKPGESAKKVGSDGRAWVEVETEDEEDED